MKVEVVISVDLPEVDSQEMCEEILNNADFTVKSSDGKEFDVEVLDYEFED